jgi:hypothetical protein
MVLLLSLTSTQIMLMPLHNGLTLYCNANIYSRRSVIRTMWGEGRSCLNYPGIRTTEGTVRGVGIVQKVITQY